MSFEMDVVEVVRAARRVVSCFAEKLRTLRGCW
jgi:hypothetical protein